MATWTLTDLERIEKAIASGALRVRFEDREVLYQSMDALLRARELILKSLGLTNPEGNRTRAVFDKEL